MIDDEPTIREIRSPVTPAQLRPLGPDCRVIQFSAPLKEADHKKLAKLVRKNLHICFRIYAHYSVPSVDLEFLRNYPFVRELAVHVHTLRDITGLRHAPDLRDLEIEGYRLEDLAGIELAPSELERLVFGNTKTKRHSLTFLLRFANLRFLALGGQSKDIEVVGCLSELRHLTLRSITLPDLGILQPLKNLLSLDFKLGGTKDLRLLPKIGRLRYVELWRILGLNDLAPIAGVTTLQNLFLQELKNVTKLPSFAKLHLLRRVHLQSMKGLTDLAGVAKAPALEELIVRDHGLDVKAFRPFVGHPTLKRAGVGFRKLEREKEVAAMLGLPPITSPFVYDDGSTGPG